MRSWISVHLPQLPLEIFRPNWSDPSKCVVLDRDQVMVMSPAAAASGVRLGMRRASVLAISPEAKLLARDILREQIAVNSTAQTLLQYTPQIVDADSAVLLDVTASLRLFGGHRALCRRIRATVDALGYTAQIGMSPTAHGAWLLAQQVCAPHRAVKLSTLRRQLDTLPFTLLPSARQRADWLDGIGCRTLADLRRLPRAGLQRRAGEEILHALDRAYGAAAELFDWTEPPPSFSARLELPHRVTQVDATWFAVRRLIVQLTGWLLARQLAVSRFTLQLKHERGRAAIAPTAIEIAMAEPGWQEDHLLRLIKERLARVTLPAPVIALRLDAVDTAPLEPSTASLLPARGGTPADTGRLLELLAARLGADRVLIPAPRADHRPEVANGWTSAVDTAARSVPAQAMHAGADRPFWLLDAPIALPVHDHRPCYRTPLTLLRGPERIEIGWWDGKPAARDYFVAQGADAAYYWIYQERRGATPRWYLHGLFA